MTPLILRPQPAADELAASLREAGHTPVVSPLLEYRPGQDLVKLSETLLLADVVIATSKAAVITSYSIHYTKLYEVATGCFRLVDYPAGDAHQKTHGTPQYQHISRTLSGYVCLDPYARSTAF